MNQGILIYAHNSRKIDYALMSIIAGGLAKKNLNKPVSLVTDQSTVDWMIESNLYEKATNIFDKIILTDRPNNYNQRVLHDGADNELVPFINSDRCTAWYLTPYDRTLLIDSDFFVLSKNLNEYWNVDQDILIGSGINDIYGEERLGYHDRYISDTGIKLYWATTVMFSKNDVSKCFFDTVTHIKENYQYYSDLYRFDSRQYRNDISFSIAKHIFDGFETDKNLSLPAILTTLDRDTLIDVKNNKFTFLINYNLDNNFCASSLSEIDVHIMNKQSICRNKDKLLELI